MIPRHEATRLPLARRKGHAGSGTPSIWSGRLTTRARAEMATSAGRPPMMTLRFLTGLAHIPMDSAWYLTDLAEAKGRLQHLTQAAPQRLRALHEGALAESALASNRIEGVGFDASGARELIFGGPAPHTPRGAEVPRYPHALALLY